MPTFLGTPGESIQFEPTPITFTGGGLFYTEDKKTEEALRAMGYPEVPKDIQSLSEFRRVTLQVKGSENEEVLGTPIETEEEKEEVQKPTEKTVETLNLPKTIKEKLLATELSLEELRSIGAKDLQETLSLTDTQTVKLETALS